MVKSTLLIKIDSPIDSLLKKVIPFLDQVSCHSFINSLVGQRFPKSSWCLASINIYNSSPVGFLGAKLECCFYILLFITDQNHIYTFSLLFIGSQTKINLYNLLYVRLRPIIYFTLFK
jgi:hypothetical protein